MKRILWVIVGSLLQITAHAASFDCHNAHLTDIEIQICADGNVSSQDEKLASLYRKLLVGASEQQRVALKADQKQWIVQIRNACTFKDCLSDAYRMRSESLEELNLDGWQTWVPQKEAFSELAHRSGMSENELKELFRDQGSTQLAMNIGSFGAFIAVDLKLHKMLAQKRAGPLSGCSSKLQIDHDSWLTSLDRKCNQEADDEAEGGSMGPMIFTTCKETATKERIVYLRSLKSCGQLESKLSLSPRSTQ